MDFVLVGFTPQNWQTAREARVELRDRCKRIYRGRLARGDKDAATARRWLSFHQAILVG